MPTKVDKYLVSTKVVITFALRNGNIAEQVAEKYANCKKNRQLGVVGYIAGNIAEKYER